MAKQKCKICKETLELTEENFRYFKTGKWAMSCKPCAEVVARANYKFRGKNIKPKREEPIQTHIRKKDITRINLVIGLYYKLIYLLPRGRDEASEIVGKAIFQNDRYFVLETDDNIRESFLKVDSILNIYKLEKGRG